MNAERQEDEPFIPAEHITKEEATQRRPREPQQKTWWTFIKTHVAVHCIVIGIYTITAVLIVRYHIKSCARPSAFDNLIFRYTDTTFHNLSQSPYTGPPSQENEAAWENLLAPMHMRVSTEELRRANQESVNLPEGGGYLGWMGVFHELHCIDANFDAQKMLREAHYNARPSESLTVEMIMIVMDMFIISILRILRPPFPLLQPVQQLPPVATLMFRSKPRYPAQFLLLQLHGQIRLAHQTLPDQIDTVTDVRRTRHEWYILLGNLVAGDCGRIDSPVAMANTVLTGLVCM
ncbi:MAG: hypothetical protein Q9157_004542 [Trypethelium eluteriae]